jgi:multiple sugar transport system ATP-binding protein
VTVKVENDFIAVKAPKQFAGKQGERIGVSLAASRSFVFDAGTGLRVR